VHSAADEAATVRYEVSANSSALLAGKPKVVGRHKVNLSEGLSLFTVPKQAASTTHFNKVTYCYLEPMERKDKASIV
jgi:hypothetical protein